MGELYLYLLDNDVYTLTHIFIALCSVNKELICAGLTALLGMPGGVLLFLPIYHPLHDIAGIHSEVTFFILFTVFLLISWTGDRTPTHDSRPHPGM